MTEEEILEASFLLVRQGYQTRDWQKIQEAWTMVMGEPIPEPEVEKKSKIENLRSKLLTPQEEINKSKRVSDNNLKEEERYPENKNRPFGRGPTVFVSAEEDEELKRYNEAKKTHKEPRPPMPDVLERLKSQSSAGVNYSDEIPSHAKRNT